VYGSDTGTLRKSPLLRQILTNEGAAYVLLEFIEKRLRTRGRQLVAQCVNFSESGAQYPSGFFVIPSVVQLKTLKRITTAQKKALAIR
jgi:hypothetical protein